MAFISRFGNENETSSEAEACALRNMNPLTASPAVGATIPDFPFRDPAAASSSRPASEPKAVASGKTPSVPETPAVPDAAALDTLRYNLDTAVQQALQQFHAYVDAVLAASRQNTVVAPTVWSQPEGLPKDPFPAFNPLPEPDSLPRILLDAEFKEKLDRALAEAFAEASTEKTSESSAVTSPEPVPSSPETAPAEGKRKTVLPPPRNPQPVLSDTPAATPPPLTAVPVALAIEKPSPFTLESETTVPVAGPLPATPFVLAEKEAAPPPVAPAPAETTASPFSVVAPATEGEAPADSPPEPSPEEPSPFQAAPAYSAEIASQKPEAAPPPSFGKQAPATPFSSPFSIPGATPVPGSEPSVPPPPLAVETPAPLPFSPFQGLEPAPPPPLLDKADTAPAQPALPPAPAMTAQPAVASVLEPITSAARTVPPPPVVPPATLPHSRLSPPSSIPPSSENIGFNFAELLKANGQNPH